MPARWELRSPKALFGERRAPNLPEDVHLTPSQKFGVLPQSEYVERTGGSVVLNLTGQDKMKHVEENDFIIHLRSFQGGLERAHQAGKVSSAYTVIEPKSLADPGYYGWMLKSSAFIQELQTTTNQLRDGQSIRWADFIKVPLPTPPLDEQQAIADYLDRETKRIDELITEQRGLIEALRERRRAVIDAEVLPDDLVEWNEVPLRYSLTFQEGPGIGAVDFRDSGVPLLRISSIRGSVATLEGVNYLDPEKVAERWNHFRVEAGDLLINSSASMGSVAEVLDGEVVGAIPYTGIIKIRPGLMTKGFARWYFQSRAFLGAIDLLKTGSTIQHYGPSHLRQLRVFLPQTERQEEIVERLTHAVAHADSLIVESEDLIALSQERRAALITAAVTGQIDVRAAA